MEDQESNRHTTTIAINGSVLSAALLAVCTWEATFAEAARVLLHHICQLCSMRSSFGGQEWLHEVNG